MYFLTFSFVNNFLPELLKSKIGLSCTDVQLCIEIVFGLHWLMN